MNKKIFDKINLGGIEVNNRIVRSATGELMADSNGYVTDKLINMYDELCQGNIGLIITGLTEVVKGTQTHTLMKIHDDSYIEGLKKLTDSVHEKNNKIVVQLVHHGAQIHGNPDYIPYSPSGVGDEGAAFKPKEISKEEIKKIVEDFGDGALRAKKAGFDGVQIHGAHGYFFSRFLTPYYNRRNDEYGGSIENRILIILEAYENIRSKCGEDFPIFIKMNSSDFAEKDGLTFEDSKKAAKIFAKVGFDAIEISGGNLRGKCSPVRSGIKTTEDEGYHKEYADSIAKEIDIPVILVGGFRSLDVIEEALENTSIEAISMCRPFIREPKLITRWIDGETQKSKCVSCNKCFNPRGTSCIFNKN
ncbi:MAG: NADH:flavin oxidoreductase [Tepidibacter sp.]|jgi:2,4-dienoyl-CoA reductase-like NADH-dependent reductase (Old Yellow Enzyme family)|uniref:NADH:flavin oxidoreductase n=1 Tax=Tepidibacter sp. TaxID=2529387 RepID=UPI0025EED818|nr:NADH:flavin oxidoreductase [Tepidibacter sp.]MCT4509091.1 NADH:flavin oxidoreductase [Tepidibacter sp.]